MSMQSIRVVALNSLYGVIKRGLSLKIHVFLTTEYKRALCHTWVKVQSLTLV